MFQRAIAPAFVAAVSLGLSTLAIAQTASPKPADPVADAIRAQEDASHSAADNKQTPEELRTTSALNAEILDQNDLAEMEERSRLNAYANAQREYQAELARVEAERLRIAIEAEEHEARYKAEQDAYARARADWEACRDGDRTRCIVPR